jgi:hypothetical protein
MHLLSDKLAKLIELHTEQIIKRWFEEVSCDPSISSICDEKMDYMKERVSSVIFNLREWINYDTTKEEIGHRYAKEGLDYFNKKVPLCEIIRSFILLKKRIWSFSINESSIDSAYELYQMNDLDERIVIFFDQALYYITRGYMEGMNNAIKQEWKLTDDDTEKIFFHKSFYPQKNNQ